MSRNNRMQLTVEMSSLVGNTITAIHTFAPVPVHTAWVDELTTPIAFTQAILELADGQLVRVAPCEVELSSGGYPSLGLKLEACDRSTLTFAANGHTYRAKPLDEAMDVLPLKALRIEASDPLKEGAVSEVEIVGIERAIVFRHIMPPMTLGIVLREASLSGR